MILNAALQTVFHLPNHLLFRIFVAHFILEINFDNGQLLYAGFIDKLQGSELDLTKGGNYR